MLDLTKVQLQELNLVPKDLLDLQLEALEIIAIGRQDPVYFLEKALGLTFYDEQKIWLWATTHTQKEKCMDLMVKLGLFYSSGLNGLPTDIDRIYELRKHIFAVANQTGKTFMSSGKHIWSLFFKVGQNVSQEHLESVEYKTLNISPHSDQANKMYEYVQKLVKGEFVFYDPKTDMSTLNVAHPLMDGFLVGHNDTLGELRFSNNAQMYSKSSGQDMGTSRAGEQFGLITYDECAQSLHLSKEIPMLLSRLIRYGYSFDLVSSPEVEKPSHQHYFRLMKKGQRLEDNWFSITKVKFDQNIFIDPDQKAQAMEEMRTTDIAKYRQMMEGAFISTGSRFFPLEAVNQLFNSETPFKKMTQGLPGRKYLLCADWGMSDTGDPSRFFVLDYTDYMDNKVYIVYDDKILGGSPFMQLATCRLIWQNFGGNGTTDAEGNIEMHPIKFVTDTNSLGGIMIKKMLFDLHPTSFDSHGDRKDKMLAHLNLSLTYGRRYDVDQFTGAITEHNLEFGKLKSYFIEDLEEQLGGYRVDDKKIEQDAVMSLGMGIWFIEEKLPHQTMKRLDLNPLSRYNDITRRR
jgi:hypothetical protein